MRLSVPFARQASFGEEPLVDAQRLSLDLLKSRGEAHGTRTAENLAQTLASFDSETENAYGSWLVDFLGPDDNALRTSVEGWLANPDPIQAAELADHAEPRRQELLRRLNAAPGGTRLLVDWRARLLMQMSARSDLAPLEADLRHLLGSWFNRGFLRLERISWDSPARLLETLIAHEAVHSITGWDDLRGRLQGDRRCYGFFHPALPGAPLIFVEVALTAEVSSAIAPLLDHPPSRSPPVRPTAAIFYSISNCEPGLRGMNFGNFLIKQIAADLRAEYPGLSNYATLSPIPGFCRWLAAGGSSLSQAKGAEEMKRLCALYLTGVAPDGTPGRSRDAVAAFHLGNGAELWRINAQADSSEKGLAQSLGLMANYIYREERIVANHEQFVATGMVARSRNIDKLLSGRVPGQKRWVLPWNRRSTVQPSKETQVCL